MVSEDPSILPKGDNKIAETTHDDVFNEISAILKTWGRIAAALRVAHVLLIIITTVFSVYVAAELGSINADFSSSNSTNSGSSNQSPTNSNGSIALAALIAAISAALFAGLDLGSKSNNTRRAWRTLNADVMKYRAGHMNIKELIESYEKCEGLIGDVKSLNSV